jgi:hypothetical protein
LNGEDGGLETGGKQQSFQKEFGSESNGKKLKKILLKSEREL